MVAGKLAKAQAAVEKLHSQLHLAGQPHGYLLSQLQAAEADKNAAEVQLKDAQVSNVSLGYVCRQLVMLVCAIKSGETRCEAYLIRVQV